MKRYTDFEELKESLGYKSYKPKIGNVGRAIIDYSKRGNQRSVGWLKNQLDELLNNTQQKQTRIKHGNKK